VNYNTRYGSLENAVDKPDGLAVLGVMFEVSGVIAEVSGVIAEVS
jgi:hypothetical protein